jgi:hypothetical protein
MRQYAALAAAGDRVERTGKSNNELRAAIMQDARAKLADLDARRPQIAEETMSKFCELLDEFLPAEKGS